MWGSIGLGIGAAIGLGIGAVSGLGIAGPLAALFLGLTFGAAGWWLGRLMGSARHRWGTASVSRVGHEAFMRGYAESRGLKLEDRWRFHSEYRHMTWPGFADHVLAGELPQTDGLTGHFVMLGDAAEMRSTGTEIAYFSERPLASSALLVRADREMTGTDGKDVEIPEDYELEIRGRDVMVWRPIQGNLLRTAAGSDRFCAKAGAVIREVLGQTARG